MFSKFRNSNKLEKIDSFQIENQNSNSVKSTAKLGEQKVLEKIREFYEEILIEIRNTQNLYLINKIQQLKPGDLYNTDILFQNLKTVVSLLIQELIQYQLQVDSQNKEPNQQEQNIQMKLELQRFKFWQQEQKSKVNQLEQELIKKESLNKSLCEELVSAKTKFKEISRKIQLKNLKTEGDQPLISIDKNISQKLEQLHLQYGNKQKSKKLTILTEPSEQDQSLYSDINFAEACLSKQLNQPKKTRIYKDQSSISEETLNLSDSFSTGYQKQLVGDNKRQLTKIRQNSQNSQCRQDFQKIKF